MAKFGDFSPVGGMLTGEGLMGKLAASGAVGLGPQAIAKHAQKSKKEEEEERKKASGMKSGGAVKSSASKRADGCAIRGKTRGKIV